MDKKTEFESNGFAVLPGIYSSDEVHQLRNILDSYTNEMENTKPIHAIRRVVERIPELNSVLWNDNMKKWISVIAGNDYFLTKAIYFDKPENSNWFVSYHQDLSISVMEKHEIEGYKNWTKKDGQIGVEPPQNVLDNIVTFRIHLDDTDESNGALRLIPGSHKIGIRRIQDLSTESEQIFEVPEGAIMLMKPLTFHASSRTQKPSRRRVLHLEFSNMELANPLCWREKLMI